MAFHETRFPDCPVAQSSPHPVGKQRYVAARIRHPAVEIRLRGVETRRDQNAKPDEIEAMAGIDVCFERRQPFMKQFADELGLAQRTRRADRNAADSTVDPEKMKLQPFGALPAPLQVDLQLPGQHRHKRLDIVHEADGLGERPLGRKRRNRQARRDRLLHAPQGLIEPEHDVLPKRRTSGARGAARTAPDVRSPTLSSPARVAGARRKAASGKAASNSSSSPGAITDALAKRAAAQAAPGVEARPARTSNP